MANYSVYDVMLGLIKEKESLQEKWQGPIWDKYVKVLDQYINYLKRIEISYQDINEKIEEVQTLLDDDSDKEKGPKIYRR